MLKAMIIVFNNFASKLHFLKGIVGFFFFFFFGGGEGFKPEDLLREGYGHFLE